MLQGSADETAAAARRCVARLPPEDVLWADRGVRKLLGRTFQACVLDFHGGVDADLLGQCHGFVIGGGALIVRVGDSPAAYPQLAAWGFAVEDVGQRLPERVVRELRREATPPHELSPTTFVPQATADQARVVREVVDAIGGGVDVVLTAHRGRGKSAALGLAARQLRDVVVTAASDDAAAEVFRFGPADLPFVPLPRLLQGAEASVVIVDEAAQLPVGTLWELVESNPDTRFIFATTTHGYEGTGRGFALKFVQWLRERRALRELTAHQPIRWGADDPVERAVFRALLLDAEPRDVHRKPVATLRHRLVTPDELAGDEALLRQIFGLLIQAHYRTTPADLHRLLDAPNLAVHASFAGEAVVAANLIAFEGGLSADAAQQLADGAMRVVGHALPESFAAHLSSPEPATWSAVRSVRIVAHPEVRRSGVATGLIENVHAAYTPELFGTLFAAQPDVIRFRRSLGYEVLRLSASRSDRTGVPSVVMVRPQSARARAVVDALRAELARDLPTQLALLRADQPLQHGVEAALLEQLGEPATLSEERCAQIVRAYAFGPRTFESVAVAVAQWVAPRLADLPADQQALVRSRALQHHSWAAAAEAASLPSIPAAMRAMRRAIRSLVDS